MAIKKDFGTSRLQQYLIEEFTVGCDRLDRVIFYHETKGMSDSELDALKERVRKRVMDFYTGLFERNEPWHEPIVGNDRKVNLERTRRFVDKGLESWFRPWTRLAGAIESEFDICELRLSPEQFDEKFLSSVLMKYSRLEEYKLYLDREFKGFVSNKCLDYGLDYSMMAPELRTPDLLKKWEEDYPYLMESKEWDILSMAYNAGGPRKMTLQEEPGLSNGFIGGVTSWSSFLNVVYGPVLEDGKVTGLGQIDYKDCTNTFVVLDGNRKALFFDGLSK